MRMHYNGTMHVDFERGVCRKNRKRRFAAFAFALLLCLSVLGCDAEAAARADVFAMDTVMTLSAYGKQKHAAIDACKAELFRLDALFSVTNAKSDVRRVMDGAGAFIDVSSETLAILAQASALFYSTDGAFDVTVFPLMEAWGFYAKAYTVPEDAAIRSLLTRVDGGAVEITETAARILPGMGLDFGAIAKGFASQRMAELFMENGVTSGIVSLGGNVQAIGSQPDGTPWSVGIADPRQKEKLTAVLSCSDEAVVTSGGYNRFFEQDGKTYHHILDPRTGYPADAGLLSVTVVCENGMAADGLSTALFVMGLDAALSYYDEYGGFEAVFVTEDDTVVITGGLKGRIDASMAEGFDVLYR